LLKKYKKEALVNFLNNPIKISIAAGYSKAFKSIKRCKGKARKY